MERARARGRALSSGPALAVLLLVLASTPALAAQTFPDPFGGAGTHTDLRAGSKGEDIGDVFLIHDGPTLSIRIFLDPPSTFIESHVCLSAVPFTDRVPPGQCQYQASGAASGTYDITLPPDEFPSGTTPFSDPLGPLCAQVHVAYDAPGLALTRGGGGSAYGGWEPGKPFFGSICMPAAPDPEPPTEATVVVDKTGAVVAGDVTYTVTVENPTTETATDVTLVETLPSELSWTLPPECAAASGNVVICDLGDIAGGDSVELFFTATPDADQCGTFVNLAEAFIGDKTTPSSTDADIVEVVCPPQPDEPTILITKVATSTAVTVPGTLSYIVTVENVGPGDAINVQFTDELPPGPTWSIGSGSRVCSITGNTLLSCFAPVVPDGVFEVIEIFGAVDGSFCGAIDNSASIAWEGGTERGVAIADAGQIEITGCGAVTPTPVPNPSSVVNPSSVGNPSSVPNPTGDAGAGGGGGGDVPNTSMDEPVSPVTPLAVLTALAFLAAALTYLRLADRRRR